MGMRAYFMINVAKETVGQNAYMGMVGELEAMPEVIAVEPVFGIYDLMVEVDAPVRVIYVANKVMEKEWVKRLHILRAFRPDGASGGRLPLKDYVKAWQCPRLPEAMP